MNKLLYGIGVVMEFGGILALAGIALKRNNDCYKAECKLANVELNRLCTELDGMLKDVEISMLKRELAELKTKYENGEA